MAERGVLGLRGKLDAAARQPYRLVEALPEIEVDPREEEMPFREAGVHLEGLAVRVDLPAAVADALVDPSEVERGLVAVRMQVNLFGVLGDGALEVPLLFGQKRQVVMREPNVGLLGNRGADLAFGAAEIAAPEREDAERVARRGELR